MGVFQRRNTRFTSAFWWNTQIDFLLYHDDATCSLENNFAKLTNSVSVKFFKKKTWTRKKKHLFSVIHFICYERKTASLPFRLYKEGVWYSLFLLLDTHCPVSMAIRILIKKAIQSKCLIIQIIIININIIK